MIKLKDQIRKGWLTIKGDLATTIDPDGHIELIIVICDGSWCRIKDSLDADKVDALVGWVRRLDLYRRVWRCLSIYRQPGQTAHINAVNIHRVTFYVVARRGLVDHFKGGCQGSWIVELVIPISLH